MAVSRPHAVPNGDDAAVLIIAHGSRDQAAREEFLEQVQAISAHLPGTTIGHAVLEFPWSRAPSIGDAVDAMASSVKNLVVLPLFLFDAGHVRRDIPAELAAARERSPHLKLIILPQVSDEDGLLDVLVDRVRSARNASEPRERWAALVIGAGTSSSEANAELVSMAVRLRGQLSTSIVEPAFVSLARPTVTEGIARCVEQGARQVVTVSYFLNTGVLARRIEPQARAEAQRLGVDITIGEHFGTHKALAESLARRIHAALMGNDPMGRQK
jgi:sirohydrochlorin cobaltochelatase